MQGFIQYMSVSARCLHQDGSQDRLEIFRKEVRRLVQCIFFNGILLLIVWDIHKMQSTLIQSMCGVATNRQ